MHYGIKSTYVMVYFNNTYIVLCYRDNTDDCNIYKENSNYKASNSFANIPDEMPTTFIFNVTNYKVISHAFKSIH